MHGETLYPSTLRRSAGQKNITSITLIGVILIGVLSNAVFAGQLTLTWDDNSDNEDGFKIERSLDGESFAEIATVAADVSTFLDISIVENLTYTYRVKAYNEHTESGYSNSASGQVELLGVPSISDVADFSLLEGGEPGAILFTIGDSDTNEQDLVVTANSSNQSLQQNDGIEIGGVGAERSISLNPVGGVSGTSIITISVSDGVNITSTSFEFEVRSPTAPIISSIGDIEILVGELIEPISFTIGDQETAADDLVLSFTSSNNDLLPVENINVTGAGGERTLTLNPILDQLGEVTITIAVSDGSSEVTETFKLLVQSAPTILTQPLDTEGIVGDITALAIEVSAYPDPHYQWLFNESPIEGANEAELLFTNLELSHSGTYTVLVANEFGIVTSVDVELSVGSLIRIIQSPVNVTIEGEGTAVLSVVAEGPGLTFQWYRGESGNKSNPIEGATSSNYETDTLSSDAKYWVEIKTGGLAQGLETVISDTIDVLFRLSARYYFGEVGPGEMGEFGLYVRGNNTGVLIANLAFLNAPFVIEDLEITEQGRFEYRDSKGMLILYGTVDDESVSGSFSGSTIGFSGLRSNSNGNTSVFDGYYSAVIPNTSDGEVLLIAGPDGQSFVSISLGNFEESGAATVDDYGTVTASLNSDIAVALALDDSYSSLSGILLIGEENYIVDGQREDVSANNLLFNTSIRGQVKGGSSTMIAGFVVGGTGKKKVLIRGLGPSLVSRGVASAVADPMIQLYQLSDGGLVAENDDWGLAVNAADVSVSSQLAGATPLASNSKDAVLLLELPVGVYTAVVRSVTSSEGTALVEIFDVSEAEGTQTGATLANISMRGEVGSGDNVTIAGFVVTGDSPKRLLIRVMGSELEKMGVSGTLMDPVLSIYKATNEGSILVGENDNWQEEGSVATSAAAQSGAFAFDEGSNSAAKVIWLEPGLYTAVAQSADSSEGVVLVEVYEVE